MTKTLLSRVLPSSESPKLVPILILASVVLHALFFYVGHIALGDVWINSDPAYMGRKIMTHLPSAGVTIFMMGSIAGPFSLGFAIHSLYQQKHVHGRFISLLWGTLILLCSISMCIVCWTKYIDASKTFAVEVPDNLYEFMGSLTFSAYVPTTLACLWILYRLAKSNNYSMTPKLVSTSGHPVTAPSEGSQHPAPFQRNSLFYRWKGIFWGMLALGTCFFFSCILAPSWVYNAGMYFRMKADPYYTILDIDTTLPLPDIVQRWVPPSGYLSPLIYVKLPPYVAIYYGVLGSLFFLGILGTFIPRVRRFLQQRMRFPAVSKSYQPFPLGISRGEFIVLFASVALMVYWGVYWGFVDKNIQTQPSRQNDTHHPKLNILGRASGHLASLSLALALLPVSRNSVWDAAWGVPFEKAVRYHRIVGRLAWLFSTIHMITWHIKWIKEGIFWKSAFQADELYISPCPEGGCVEWKDGKASVLPQYHIDNFTIPLSQFAWILFTLAIIVAQCFRRSRYQLFRITHIAAIFFCIVGFIHAHIYWHYAVIGFSLWAFDRVIRYVNSTRDLPFISLETEGDVTRLVLQITPNNTNFSSFTAGQYAWICVPTICPFDWHPFTISSAPSDALPSVHQGLHSFPSNENIKKTNTSIYNSAPLSNNPAMMRHLSAMQICPTSGYISFHIKDQGRGTWTNKLRKIALDMEGKRGFLAQDIPSTDKQSVEDTSPKLDLHVCMEGPYGRIGDLEAYETLILVAGGIGITPFHSILTELYARKRNNKVFGSFPSKLKKICLVWCYRGDEVLRNFVSSIKVIMENNYDGLFEIHLFNTLDATNVLVSDDSTEWGSLYEENEPVDEIKKPLLSSASQTDTTMYTTDKIICAELESIRHEIKIGRPNIKQMVRGILNPSNANEKHFSGRVPDYSSGVLQGFSQFLPLSNSFNPKDPSNFEKICILACGPQALLVEASESAFENNVSFHNEEFFF